MSLRFQSHRIMRCRSIIHLSQTRITNTPIRQIFTTKPPPPPSNPLDPIALHRHEAASRVYFKRRTRYSVLGIVVGLAGMLLTARQYEVSRPKSKMDEGANGQMSRLEEDRKIIVEKRAGEVVEDSVPTGTSTVPTFPRTMEYADVIGEDWKKDGLVEYQLMGLGVRTVSFLGIEVYVVGIYVATDDIATLQQRLIRQIDPIATTLVAGEKDKLKMKLLDGEMSEGIWSELLREGGVRSVVRIVPCKNTDFHHMRDAWVRALKARAQKNPDEYGDDAFGQSVQQFKSMLTGGSVPKGREMLLGTGRRGELSMWYDDGKEARRLGGLDDERVSRALLLNYLGGKTVASEKARASVVEGVIEIVERPVGTVATQVHV